MNDFAVFFVAKLSLKINSSSYFIISTFFIFLQDYSLPHKPPMKPRGHPHGQLGVKELLHIFRPESQHKVFARFGVQPVAEHEAVVFFFAAGARDKNRLAKKAIFARKLD